MKAFVAAVVAVFCFVLAGCTTTADLKALEIQDRQHERIVKFNDDAETRAARVWIEINKEREKTKQMEAEASKVRFGAMMKVAEKADAGGRVAIARSLEERAPSGAAAVADVAMPKPALMPVPTIQLPKSGVDRFLDAADRGLDKGIRITGLLLGYKGLGKQLDADVRRAEIAETGQTARHGATMGAFTAFSNNQASQANESTRGFSASFQRLLEEGPDIVNNVYGNNNSTVIGDGTATNTTTTNTVRCDQTQNARTGEGGQGGPGGTSTTGSNNNGAPGGSPAANNATQSQPCNAGK